MTRYRNAAFVGLLAMGLVGAAALPAGAVALEPKVSVGKAPAGVGIGSKAALAREGCDPERKRMDYATVGGGPLCVTPWPDGKNNGGATYAGVTGTTVKVVVLTPTPEQEAAQTSRGGSLPKNQATGEQGTWEDAFRDFQTVIVKGGAYETRGRAVELEFVQSSGSDEASQRSDALKVAELKPFIVIDATDQSLGMPVFESEIARRKIIVNGAALTTKAALAQAPYRWSTSQDDTASIYLAGEFVGKTLSGKKAKWAGDAGLRSQPHAFGLVYPQDKVDPKLFDDVVAGFGGTKPTVSLAYDPTEPTKYEEAAPVIIGRMKAAGVNNVILFAEPSMVSALTRAASSNEFSPEWMVTGFSFHDFDGFGRGNDQDQFAHAFGLGTLYPLVTGTQSTLGAFPWYWGTSQGTANPTVGGWMTFVYNAIHYAGPKLTPQNVRKGLFAVPAVGGAATGGVTFQSGLGRSVGLPYDEYSALGTDKALIWWDPTTSGGANAVASFTGKGKFRYLEDGKRRRYGQMPKSLPPFFDTSKAVAEIPAGVAGANTTVAGMSTGAQIPCDGCPSSESAN